MRAADVFREAGLAVREGVPLSGLTTLRVGGRADLLFTPQSLWELLRGLRLCDELGLEPLLLGGGSNLLVRDGGWRGVVVDLGGLRSLELEGDVLWAEAGVPLPALLSFCLRRGLAGLEFLAGVPASVGGAVVMNAGAFGRSVGEVVREVAVIEGGRFRVLGAEELPFAYRSWGGPPGALVVRVGFALEGAPKEEVRRRMRTFLRRRRASQPLRQPSAGCVFRNPPEAPAGYLIERAGLKGRVRGGAMVSPKHANFIVNLGRARAADVLALMEEVKEGVFRTFGVELREEVVIVGEA